MFTRTPSWIEELRHHPALSRFTWIEEEAARRIRIEWLDAWSQIAFEAPFHRHCRERLARCVPLAVGPARERRLSRQQSRMALVFDPEFPELVALSLSHAIPSACWSLADADDLADVLAPYLAVEPAPVSARKERFVKPLEVDGLERIAAAIDALELWMDDAMWGSSATRDPWLSVPRELNMLSLSVYVQQFGAQDPDRFPTLGCRTLWSRSTMRIEQHPRGLYAFELRFRPAADARALAHLDELLGIRLPGDLPLDLAASLLRGPTLGMAEIEALDVRGEAPFEALALRCAITPSAPEAIARLRRAIDSHREDGPALGAIAGLASSYHHDELLFEIAEIAKEPLLGELLAFLRPPEGAAP